MAAKHMTMRGEPIDMAALVAKNATQPAVGNAKLNARGDVLDNRGQIIRTQEQVEAEWRRQQELQDSLRPRAMNLKADLASQMPEPVVVVDEFEPPAVEPLPEPVSATPSRRRKIVEE
jgi:hypothetical protein